MEEAIALYDPQTHPRSTFHTTDPRVDCFSYASHILWHLGYPEQALKRSHEALALAAGLSHPFSLTYVTVRTALLSSFRREGALAREQAEAGILLATEQGFPFWVAFGTMLRGWALAEQGQVEEGITQMRQGLAAWRAAGANGGRPYFLGLLAEACGKARQLEEGLTLLTEALAVVEKNEEHRHEAELYRLKGELTLQSESQSREVCRQAAEACFLKAIEVARHQQAKSLELRAVMSLSRLRQQQGKRQEAHQLLSEIYHWFTEGFDTRDLQEAKALLAELAGSV
jgi:predicted ATPase